MTESVPNTKKVIELLLPHSFCGTLNRCDRYSDPSGVTGEVKRLGHLGGTGPQTCRVPSREKLHMLPAPSPPRCLAIRHFQGRGVGVWFEGPRGRYFIRPPLLYTLLEVPGRVFSGLGVGVHKIWPRVPVLTIVESSVTPGCGQFGRVGCPASLPWCCKSPALNVSVLVGGFFA